MQCTIITTFAIKAIIRLLLALLFQWCIQSDPELLASLMKMSKKVCGKQILLFRYIVIYMWNIFCFINDFNGITKITHFSNHIFLYINKKVSQLLFLILSAASPGKDNGTEPISIMFNKVGEHIWRDLGPFLHAEPFKILHILKFALTDCPLQFIPRVFDSPESERAIAKQWFCFHGTISVLILKCVWGHCLVWRSTYGQVSASWQRQAGFWIKCPGTWWNCFDALGPKHQWSTTIFDSRYEVIFIVSNHFFDSEHADGVHGQKVPFRSHLTIAPCSTHSSNDVWQTPGRLNLLVALSKGFLVQPFQSGCCGVLWLILRLCDPKTQLKSAVLELWS